MNYFFFDTERIRCTKIYMLGYVLTNERFEILEQRIIIDSSIDVSNRKDPKHKVNRFKNSATIVNGIVELFGLIEPYLRTCKCVCFSKDDYTSINDQLKIAGKDPIFGEYYDVKIVSSNPEFNLPSNLGEASKRLKLKHDAHNPVSDSYVTMELFKYILKSHNENEMLTKIPNKNRIIDIIANGSYAKRGLDKA